MINAKGALFGAINVGMLIPDVEVINHYLEDRILFVELDNHQTISIDISKYIGELTETKINALENMTVSIENGELIFTYDETVLNFDFSIENNDLLVDDNDEYVEFTIIENKELEVSY